MRLSYSEILDIQKKLGVDKLYSFSRIDTFVTDTYTYYLRYIAKIKPDITDGIYNVLGTVAHDLIDDCINGKVKESDLPSLYDTAFMEKRALGFVFDRSNSEQDKNISNNYYDCMMHYFTHFHNPSTPEHKVSVEPFVLIKINGEENIYFQGYIDALEREIVDGKQNLIITDFKTSSSFSAKELLKKRKQLLLYAQGIHQKTNLPYENIKIRFNMLKYVSVQCKQVKGIYKDRLIERNQIGSKLNSSAMMWLKKLHNYSEDELNIMSAQIISDNSLESLPQDVQDNFIFNEGYVYVEYTEDDINELNNEIIAIITDIQNKTKEYEKTKDDKVFWQDVTKEDTYRLNLLSDYSRKYHKPLDMYLTEREAEKSVTANMNSNINNSSDDKEIENLLNDLLGGE